MTDRRPWHPEDLALLKRRWWEQWSKEEIAEELGRTPMAIKTKANRSGFRRPTDQTKCYRPTDQTKCYRVGCENNAHAYNKFCSQACYRKGIKIDYDRNCEICGGIFRRKALENAANFRVRRTCGAYCANVLRSRLRRKPRKITKYQSIPPELVRHWTPMAPTLSCVKAFVGASDEDAYKMASDAGVEFHTRVDADSAPLHECMRVEKLYKKAWNRGRAPYA
jgi:hypothetical protein